MPTWLWPEIAIEAWREGLVLIAEIAGHALTGRAAPRMATGDPFAFGLACYTSGMGPLLAWWREQGLVRASADVTAVLELHGRHNRARHRRLTGVLEDIMARFGAARIPVAVLKGQHTATSYFPAEGTRPMADIDLLVAKADADAVGQLLAVAGLRPGTQGFRETHWHPREKHERLRTLFYVHQDDPWSIDLHHSLDQFVTAGGPIVRFDDAAPLRHMSPLPDLPGARGLDQPLLLLHLAAHAGGTPHNLTLLRLAELHIVIRRDEAAGRLSWPDFVEVGAAIGALGYAYPALKLCEVLIPGTVPRAVLDRCAAVTPARVVRFIGTLTPATAQRVDRNSVAEHFMWTTGWQSKVRQLAADIAPSTRSWRATWSIYERRAWQLLRGQVDV